MRRSGKGSEQVAAVIEHPGCGSCSPRDRPQEREPVGSWAGCVWRDPRADGFVPRTPNGELDHLVDQALPFGCCELVAVGDGSQLVGSLVE